MKETLISCSIFFFFAITCLISIKYTDKFCADISALTKECETKIKLSDWDGASEAIKKAREVFVKKTPVLESYLLHNDVECLSDILTDIEVSVELREKGGAISAIRIFARRLSELAESDKLTINNIL